MRRRDGRERGESSRLNRTLEWAAGIQVKCTREVPTTRDANSLGRWPHPSGSRLIGSRVKPFGSNLSVRPPCGSSEIETSPLANNRLCGHFQDGVCKLYSDCTIPDLVSFPVLPAVFFGSSRTCPAALFDARLSIGSSSPHSYSSSSSIGNWLLWIPGSKHTVTTVYRLLIDCILYKH